MPKPDASSGSFAVSGALPRKQHCKASQNLGWVCGDLTKKPLALYWDLNRDLIVSWIQNQRFLNQLQMLASLGFLRATGPAETAKRASFGRKCKCQESAQAHEAAIEPLWRLFWPVYTSIS